MSLVLDWSNGTLGNPVNLISKVRGIKLGIVELGLELSLVTVHSLPLLWGVVRHVVDTTGRGSLNSVALINLCEGLLELSSSESELSGGSVRFSVLGDVVDEFVISGSHNLRLEKLGSGWGFVVQSDDGKGGSGSESGDSSLGSHDKKFSVL